MGKRHGSVDVELIAHSCRPHRAGEITKSVGREHGGPLEWRDEEGAGQVRHMVFNAVVLGANGLRVDVARGGKVLLNSPEVLQGLIAVESKAGHADGVKKLGRNPCPWVAGNGHVVDILDGQPGFGEAVADCVRGEACGVLYAIEALFLDRRDQSAITNKGRRSVGVICVNAQDIHRFMRSSATRPRAGIRESAYQVVVHPSVQDEQAPHARPARLPFQKVFPNLTDIIPVEALPERR